MKIDYRINKHTISFRTRKAEIRQIFSSYGRFRCYIKWTKEVCAIMGQIDGLFSTKAGKHWADQIIAHENTEEDDDNAD